MILPMKCDFPICRPYSKSHKLHNGTFLESYNGNTTILDIFMCFVALSIKGYTPVHTKDENYNDNYELF